MLTINCSDCGKIIPFNGKVCPYCHADKTEDKESNVRGMALLVFLFLAATVGAIVGGQVSDTAEFCVGPIIVLVVGARGYMALAHLDKKPLNASPPRQPQ